MQPLTGKGMSIWKIAACENGDVPTIVQRAQDAGLRHVHIKVADGTNASNGQPAGALVNLVNELKAVGIQAWGWHFLYGIRNGVNQARAEAERALNQISTLKLDGYALDFENTGNPQFTWNGSAGVATTFMNTLRAGVGANYPIAAKSHALMTKFGTDNIALQPAVPFDAFIQQCNILIPQVYWVFDTPERRLRESHRQYALRWPDKVFAPYGAAYGEKQGNGKFWEATPDEIKKFMDVARDLKMPAAAFYSWDYAGTRSEMWNAIANYDWPIETGGTLGGNTGGVLPSDLIVELFEAFNVRNLDAIMAVYSENVALTVPGTGILQTKPIVRQWYANWLNKLPNAKFTLDRAEDLAANRGRYAWSAQADTGEIVNGDDVVNLLDGNIVAHTMLSTFKPK